MYNLDPQKCHAFQEGETKILTVTTWKNWTRSLMKWAKYDTSGGLDCALRWTQN